MSRIQISDLPTNCELNTDEARSVQGGYNVEMKQVFVTSYQTGSPAGIAGQSRGTLTGPGTSSNGIIAILIGL